VWKGGGRSTLQGGRKAKYTAVKKRKGNPFRKGEVERCPGSKRKGVPLFGEPEKFVRQKALRKERKLPVSGKREGG